MDFCCIPQNKHWYRCYFDRVRFSPIQQIVFATEVERCRYKLVLGTNINCTQFPYKDRQHVALNHSYVTTHYIYT